MMVSLLIATGLAAASPLRGEPVQKTLPGSIPVIELANAVGKVKVTADPTATQTVVHAQPLTWKEGCEIRFSGNSNLARAEVVREGEPAGMACRTRWEITLAGATELVVDQRAGAVKMEGLTAPVAVHVGTGRIRLRYDTPPTGTVAASVGLGRVVTHFPYGTWLNLHETDAKLGLVRTAIPNRNDSDTALAAGSKVGNVRVRTVLTPWEERYGAGPVATAE
ncbi:MAG: hypothetical protein H6739_31080 [Alphaproteobacteria bacterium]|nr:hypothetical protein [Alphaproteobacteria bacterium]